MQPSEPSPQLPAQEPIVHSPQLPAQEPIVHSPQLPAQQPFVFAPQLPAQQPIVNAPQLPAQEPIVHSPQFSAQQPFVFAPQFPAQQPINARQLPAQQPFVFAPQLPAQQSINAPQLPAQQPTVHSPQFSAQQPFAFAPQFPARQPINAPQLPAQQPFVFAPQLSAQQPTVNAPQLPAQQPTVNAIPQISPNFDTYESRRSVVNGIFQIIVGIFCIIVNSIAIGIGWGSIGHGYWGGIFYIVTGSLGVAAGKKMSKCLIIAFMVLCIIAASLIAPGHLAAALVGTISFSHDIGYYSRGDGVFGTQIVLSILAVIEFFFAVWGSTIWCKAVGGCCNDNQTATPVQLVQMNNGQPIFLLQASGGQYVPYNFQPSQYSNYPAPANQGYHLPQKVQPNDNHVVTNPDPVIAYQSFA